MPHNSALQQTVLQEKMSAAWVTLRDKLFCPETNLIYDSLSSPVMEQRFNHLPYPEEIARSVPNPAGWGTGMEDCSLNAGSVVEICLLQSELFPLLREESLDFVRKIVKGMAACATVHGKRGFVARGISPRDNRSCYINSSRDQFTLFVYGLWRFYHHSNASDADREQIRQLLTAVADYTISVVRPETGNNLLRLDGCPGMVSQMIDVGNHEEFRLPMIYLAAWDVSGCDIYWQHYENHAERALDVTLALDCRKNWWNLELVQMQISLAVAEAADPDVRRQEKIRRAMLIVAELAEQHFCRDDVEGRMLNFSATWSQPAVPWHSAWKMTLRPESIHHDQPSLYYGLLYLKPWENQDFINAFDVMRAIGNLAVTVALCKDYRVSNDFSSRFAQAASIPDYVNHTSGGICNMLHGYYLLAHRDSAPISYERNPLL